MKYQMRQISTGEIAFTEDDHNYATKLFAVVIDLGVLEDLCGLGRFDPEDWELVPVSE